MDKIIRGVHEFQSQIFGTQKELFERLSGGQSPDALFITCSDSRIDPSLITQTSPGEIFVLRNAGNIVPPYGASTGGEAAAVEFAVAGLGVRDIIVCGHSQCGAVAGLLNPEKLTGLPTVATWLGHASSTQRVVEEKYADSTPEERMTAAVKENVLVQLNNLRTHPCVASGLSRGELNLHAWVYEFEYGVLNSYSPEECRFLPLEAAAPTD